MIYLEVIFSHSHYSVCLLFLSILKERWDLVTPHIDFQTGWMDSPFPALCPFVNLPSHTSGAKAGEWVHLPDSRPGSNKFLTSIQSSCYFPVLILSCYELKQYMRIRHAKLTVFCTCFLPQPQVSVFSLYGATFQNALCPNLCSTSPSRVPRFIVSTLDLQKWAVRDWEMSTLLALWVEVLVLKPAGDGSVGRKHPLFL